MNSNEITLFDQIKDLIRLDWTDSKIALELNISTNLVEAYRRLAEYEEVKKEEEESAIKNYVKLSLETYEGMKNKIDQQEVDISYLESEVKRLTGIVTKLGIPAKIINKVGVDIPLSCCWQDDLPRNKRKYRIDFEVDPVDLMEE